jgi:hypothetical protein
MIEDGQSPESARSLSFVKIVARLKENRFQITAGKGKVMIEAAANPRIPR